MDLNFFRGETVVILRTNFSESQTTEWGTYTQTTQEIEVEAVIGVDARGLVSSKTTQTFTNATENTTITAFFNSGTEIYPEDKFIVRGTLWEKETDALPTEVAFRSPNTLLQAPVKIFLRQVKGSAGQEPNSNEAIRRAEAN